MPETWGWEGSQKSVMVILAEMHSSGDMEIEEATSYSQAVPPVEGCLGCFQNLAITNKAPINIVVHKSL